MLFEKSRATEFWLRVEQSILTAMEKSAEGIVGEDVPLPGLETSHEDQGGLTPLKARTVSERN